mgnify:CR=1 FL=1
MMLIVPEVPPLELLCRLCEEPLSKLWCLVNDAEDEAPPLPPVLMRSETGVTGGVLVRLWL